MNRHSQESHYPGFLFGLVTGAALGSALAMYFSPKIGSEIRRRVAASAKDLGDTAAEYYEEASTRVGDAVGDLTSGGRKAREPPPTSSREARITLHVAHMRSRVVRMRSSDSPIRRPRRRANIKASIGIWS